MNTTLVARSPKSLETWSAWSTISWAVNERLRPFRPVAQKAQPMPQPAWVDTQTDSLLRRGMPTVSTEMPSWYSSRYLREPSLDTCLVSSVGVSKANASFSCSRKALGRLVMSSNEQTFFSKTHSMSCYARKAGWPSSATSSRISF